MAKNWKTKMYTYSLCSNYAIVNNSVKNLRGLSQSDNRFEKFLA